MVILEINFRTKQPKCRVDINMLVLYVFCRSSGGNDTEPEQEEVEGEEDLPAEREFLRQPRSVQWLDLGQSLVCADLFEQYRSMLWTHCSHALWLWLHLPSTGNTAGSINLWHNHMRFCLMHRLSQASKTGMKQ